ncbi:MAG: DsbA family protein [Gemmatimonadetes bacterium]|nr:DsbA family protein [Gemmatimonadota bacterium]
MSKKNRERKKYGSGEGAVGPKNEMMKFYWILGSVAVLGIVIVGYSVGSKAMADTVSEPIEMAGLEDPTKLMEVARGITKGDPNAPFTIMEFADFQCPACGQFYAQVGQLIESEFVKTGKAKFVYYDFPLTTVHPNAFLAARAGHCAEDQEKFWEFHDVMYRNQNRWAGSQNPTSNFEDYAKDLGLDANAFNACLESDKHADVVTANMELGNQLHVPGTPTILVTQGKGVGRKVESSIEGIRTAIEMMSTGG